MRNQSVPLLMASLALLGAQDSRRSEPYTKVGYGNKVQRRSKRKAQKLARRRNRQ